MKIKHKKKLKQLLFTFTLTVCVFIVGCDSPEDIQHKIAVSSDFQVAQKSYINGDYQRSIDHYTKLINKYPEEDDLYMRRGDAYRDAGDTAKAIADFSYVIAQNGKEKGQALLKTALIYFYADDLKNAEMFFDKITKSNFSKFSSEVWSSYYHLGQIAYKKGQFQAAINFYNEADISCRTQLTNYHKANAFYSLGLLDSARFNFNKSIKFVKREFVNENPTSALAQCDTCGFPFGSKEYESLTIPSKDGYKRIMEKLENNKIFQDVTNHPEKYLDTNDIKKNKDLHLIR